MNTRVPIPTDNIYKFYALFGLALLFACIIAFVSTYNTHLDRTFDVHEELEILKKLKKPTGEQQVRIEILERKAEIDPENKKFYMSIINGGVGISIVIISFGFFMWQFKVQPKQDELIKKQLEKIDLEIKALNKQLNNTPCRRRMH